MPERDPAINPTCVRCGSDALIPDVFVQAKGYGAVQLQVGLHTRPDAVMLKRTVVSDASARVCGECGAVELLADDPHALWEAHVDRLANER
ncbi:MAG: hypothetical protein AAGI52_05705 [Bacteroidota bacterium]